MVLIGSSGFSYTEHDSRPAGAGYGMSSSRTRTVTVTNTQTGKTVFTVKGSRTRFKRMPDRTSTGVKTFLGFDGRYYHLHVTHGGASWGQIQSDGAVIKEDRTILKHLDFYPLNITKPTVPSEVLKEVVKSPVAAPISALPAVVSINTKPETKTQETLSWIQRLINWIKKILNT